MKSIKMALLGGAALAVTAAAAQADDLETLKAQIETLNARVAAMEAAPAVPAGYQLLTISEGTAKDIPGLELSPGERKRAGTQATVISVLPTADAPAGATISWSGRVSSSLVSTQTDRDFTVHFSDASDANEGGFLSAIDQDYSEDGEYSLGGSTDDLDVVAQSRLKVVATTDTAVGEVGVSMELRGNFNGGGQADAYVESAWGYWAMTPELAFGGGYTGSLGNVGYGFDGVCQCYQIDASDAFSLNPGDTSQMRLSYASGPVSMAVALEDAGRQGKFGDGDDGDGDGADNGEQLGAAGKLKYSGDMFNGEISAVYRSVDEDYYDSALNDGDSDIAGNWQIGAGIGMALGDMASVSIGAAMGEGPTTSYNGNAGEANFTLPINNQWWGASLGVVITLSEEISAELGAAYKHRDGTDDLVAEIASDDWYFDGFESEQWAVAGGLYYTPVDQLTLGVEGEWSTVSTDWTGVEEWDDDDTIKVEGDSETFIAAFTGVWRF